MRASELARCFIVRISAETDELIEEHRRWLARRNGRRVSLAEASRDLFARALAFAPAAVSARRRAQRSRRPSQLHLFNRRTSAQSLRTAERAEGGGKNHGDQDPALSISDHPLSIFGQ